MSTDTPAKKAPSKKAKASSTKAAPKPKASIEPAAEATVAETSTEPQKKKRGRSSLTIEVPINQSTLAMLQLLVTLDQSSSIGAAAAKLLANEAETVRASISERLSGAFGAK